MGKVAVVLSLEVLDKRLEGKAVCAGRTPKPGDGLGVGRNPSKELEITDIEPGR